MTGKGVIKLAWENFQSNLPHTFHKVRLSEDFCDVTLACDDEGIVKAHKVILASGSQFFQKLLSTERLGFNPHPLLYLRGVSAGQLEAILDFLYSGEARLSQGELQPFLDLAQELEISGLIEDTDLMNKHQTIHHMSTVVSNKINTNFATTLIENKEKSKEELEPGKDVAYMSVKPENNEDESILGMIHTTKSVPWNNPTGVRKGVKCNHCPKVMKTFNFLQKHILRRHKQASKQAIISLENSFENQFNVRENNDKLLQNDENTDIKNIPDETDLEKFIAEAATRIKYEIQENFKEKEESLNPIADDFAKDMIKHNEGKLSCKVCNFVTSNTPDMNMHIQIHIQAMKKKNGSKVLFRLPCEQCQMNFSSVASLNAHKTRTHGTFISNEDLKSDTIVRKSSSPLWSLATKGLGFATCMFCNKNIPTKGGSTTTAMRHIKSKHPEEIEKYNNKIEKQNHNF